MNTPIISNKIKKVKGEQFYLIGYFLLILNQVLAQSQFNEMAWGEGFLKIIRWMLIAYFFFLIIYRNKYPKGKKGLFWIFFLCVTMIEMLFFNGKLLMLILTLVVISSYRINMTRMLKVHIKALLIGLIFVCTCSLVGFLDIQGVAKSLDNLTGFLGRTNNIRYNFGFTHFNIIPIALLFIYLYIILLKRDKYKRYYDIIAFAINFGIYFLCGSRSCILLLILAIILRNICEMNPKWFLSIGMPICICSLIGALLFTIMLPSSNAFYNPLVQKINLLLTARLTLMRRILNLYPLKLWGYGEINFDNTKEYLALDNGYIYIFVTRGIIIGLVFVYLLFALIRLAKNHNNAYELLFLIIMILGNLIDNSLLHYVTFPIYIMAFNEFVGDLDKASFAHQKRKYRMVL